MEILAIFTFLVFVYALREFATYLSWVLVGLIKMAGWGVRAFKRNRRNA